jgi:hypothetical protein
MERRAFCRVLPRDARCHRRSNVDAKCFAEKCVRNMLDQDQGEELEKVPATIALSPEIVSAALQ